MVYTPSLYGLRAVAVSFRQRTGLSFTRGEFGMASISERENREIKAANAAGNTPAVFTHNGVA